MGLTWQVARRSFRRWSTYRAATVAGVVTNTVFGYLRAYVLVAVAAAGGGTVGGWDERTLVTFSFMTQALLTAACSCRSCCSPPGTRRPPALCPSRR
ncbi:MAG TPA: hypothetical protein VFY82_12380 [Acidimicrobiales bacterium]|nr:hypothetical protein [Acidimicrobiales bacterium]